MANIDLRGRGLIVACDVRRLSDLASLVESTAQVPFVRGYKIGALLALAHGLEPVLSVIRAATDKFVMYDHQKFGTDIPEIAGGQVLDVLREVGVDGVIIFPQAGPQTLRAAVEGCGGRGLLPISGGEMTHSAYLMGDGGYIADDAPSRMYKDAAALGVEHFVVPGTRPGQIQSYRTLLSQECSAPVFLFPGIGKGQGGSLEEALDAVGDFDAFAIVGRAISASDPADATQKLWSG